MLRLLQGDVGSGKTVVALLAMLNAVETGAQAALMAPTEILARQHLATITPLAEAAGVETVLLTGREKGRNRERALAKLASGDAALAIGTHALFQDDVAFPRSGGGGRRRTASVRRSPAPPSGPERGRSRPPGDDRDTHSANPDADRLRRHRRLEAHGEAGRSAAHRDTRDAHPAPRRGRVRDLARARRRRQGVLGLPLGGGIGSPRRGRGRRAAPPARARVRRARRPRARTHEDSPQGRDHGGVR